MADRNPKRIKLDPEPEVPQPAATAVTTNSIYKMRRSDLIVEVTEVRQKYKAIAISKDQLKADFKRDLDGVSKKNQELTTERDSLLHQLQHEMSKSEALRQRLLEHQQSHKLILDSAMNENTIRMQEMSVKIGELTQQRDDFHDKMRDLTEQLNEIDEEHTCAICLSPWEAQGDHRVVSLPCGHLFGEHCILEHLAVNPRCPYCNKVYLRGAVNHVVGCRILPAP